MFLLQNLNLIQITIRTLRGKILSFEKSYPFKKQAHKQFKLSNSQNDYFTFSELCKNVKHCLFKSMLTIF